jgi:hypothetical protein
MTRNILSMNDDKETDKVFNLADYRKQDCFGLTEEAIIALGLPYDPELVDAARITEKEFQTMTNARMFQNWSELVNLPEKDNAKQLIYQFEMINVLLYEYIQAVAAKMDRESTTQGTSP